MALAYAIFVAPLSAQGAGDAVGRVFLIGLDGADWKVIDPLVEEKELPHLKSLLERGCRGQMKSLVPSWSPRIWTSVATGVTPEVHGISGFAQLVEGGLSIFSSRDVKVPLVWEIASQRGIRVGVTNFWFTYPAPAVNGFLISDHMIPTRRQRRVDFSKQLDAVASPDGADPLLYPASLAEKLEPILGAHRLESNLLGEKAPPRDRLDRSTWRGSLAVQFARLQDLLVEDGEVVEMALLAQNEFQPRLNITYLNGIDRSSHLFWLYYQPDAPQYDEIRPSERERALYQHFVPATYRHTDALLGRLLEGLTPQDVVILTSDHGFGPVKPREAATGHHGQPGTVDGIFLIAGGPVSQVSCPKAVSLYDVTPTILHLLGEAVPSYMEGRVRTDLFDPMYRKSHPVRQVEEEPTAPDRSGDAIRVPGTEDRIERLRALGYFE